MTSAPDLEPLALLLPAPRRATATGGVLEITDCVHLRFPAGPAAPLTQARAQLEHDLTRYGVHCRHAGAHGDTRVTIEIDTAAGGAAGPEAYHLRITADAIVARAADHRGAAYAVQTLRQLLRLGGRYLPQADIADAPDFAVRGVSYDVSRGRVPTLAWLQRLVERLAHLKVNQLQLYTEHTFAFAFDPQISAGCAPLTPDELRTLDDYAAARGVALVPSLACCGHMARILSLPQYRALAEVPTDKSWAELTWRERVRGLTLDVTNPASRALLARMLDEYLPLFRADCVNVCCDETFDLGQGRGAARAAEIGPGGLLLEHVLWLRAQCGRHGKRIQIWGDMLKKHPELVDRLPRDVTILNWGYTADADFDSTAQFRAAGLPTWVCPGTSTWNRFVSDINIADLNIRRFAAAGVAHGADGLLNTDWGDEGHVAPPAAAWHALALGAALAWNHAAPARDPFDAAFAAQFLGDGGRAALAAWRSALAASATLRIWPAFAAPLREQLLPDEFDEARLAAWEDVATLAAGTCSAVEPLDAEAEQDRDELALALRLHALAAQRAALTRRLMRGDAGARGELREFAVECHRLLPSIEAQWLARAKRSELDAVLAVFRRLAQEAAQASADLDSSAAL